MSNLTTTSFKNIIESLLIGLEIKIYKIKWGDFEGGIYNPDKLIYETTELGHHTIDSKVCKIEKAKVLKKGWELTMQYEGKRIQVRSDINCTIEAIIVDDYSRAIETIKNHKQKLIDELNQINRDEVMIEELDLETDIDFENLSHLNILLRTYNALQFHYKLWSKEKHVGQKLKDLANLSISEFSKMRNVGPRTIDEVIELLGKAGLKPKP